LASLSLFDGGQDFHAHRRSSAPASSVVAAAAAATAAAETAAAEEAQPQKRRSSFHGLPSHLERMQLQQGPEDIDAFPVFRGSVMSRGSVGTTAFPRMSTVKSAAAGSLDSTAPSVAFPRLSTVRAAEPVGGGGKKRGRPSYSEDASVFRAKADQWTPAVGAVTEAVTMEDAAVQVFEAEARKVFAECDKNRDGQVSKSELKKIIKKSKMMREALKLRTFSDCTKFVEEADTDGDGQLSFEEFRDYLKAREAEADRQAEITAREKMQNEHIETMTIEGAFQEVDRDGDGRIDYQELKIAYAALLWKQGKKVDKKKVAKWVGKAFRKHDKDKDGTLDASEFRHLVMQSAFSAIFEGVDPDDEMGDG